MISLRSTRAFPPRLSRFAGLALPGALAVWALACSDETRNEDGGGASGSAGSGGMPPDALIDCGTPDAPGIPDLELSLVAGGLTAPLYVVEEPLPAGATAPADTRRLYVVERGGRIRLLIDGELQPESFLDLDDRVFAGGERGLLGLAFHPNYRQNGALYVNYSAANVAGVPNGSTVVSEFRRASDDENRADPASERIVVGIPQPESNHNGGNLQFGPDGMLYVGMGDGGSGDDPHGPIGNGQNLQSLLGKMLRIDVDGRDAGEYSIPGGNLAEGGALPEIWSYGLRNPWRFSFDACTGDLYIGDVGQRAQEEVDFEPAGTSGRNYGWRCAEGDRDTANDCPGIDRSTFVAPIASYGRGLGQSITGGYVYRGSAIPELRGTYLYADYESARFFALRVENGALAAGSDQDVTDNLNPGGGVGSISSFGQDNSGEIYVVSLDGAVYRITAP